MGALKYDGGKTPWNLLVIEAVEGKLKVLHYGKRKYTVCGDCKDDEGQPTKIYPNPRLDGDPERSDCPKCGSTNLVTADNNWRKGFVWSRLIASAYRHLGAFLAGDDTDEESGLPTIDHLMCCVAFLSAHQKCGYGTDDRWRKAVSEQSETPLLDVPETPLLDVPEIPKDGKTVIEGDWMHTKALAIWNPDGYWQKIEQKTGEREYVSCADPITWKVVVDV
jgi:hypothetical protein